MNKIQKAIVIAGGVVVLGSILFPPYAAMKLHIEENVHGFIGYHPIWDPPTREYAYQVLHGERFDPTSGVDLSSYTVIFNKVRFVFNLVIVLLISSVLLALFRKRRKNV